MNGPFVVAQAGSNANSGSAPVQIIRLIKPEAGKTEIFHASFNGEVKIDFTAIANEKITLFHDSKTQSLHVIFADGSQDIIEPFFDSRGTILGNLLLEMGPNVVYGGEQFAQTFTISEDPSVLPAAGPGGVASGADFLDAVVDPFGLTNPLDLLPPEELPNIAFTVTQAPIIEEDLIPTVSGHVLGIVEEEALNAQVIEQPSDSGQGNEDTHDASGNDHDTSNTGPGSQITTQIFSGTLAGLVSGGNLPITFLSNIGANGTDVHDSNGNVVTSIGLAVHYEYVSAGEIDGKTSDGRLIFTLTIGSDGAFTFTLNDQIDHPNHSHDFGGNAPGIFEETLNLDLSNAVVAHDATPTPVVFPANTFDVGVIDDTPIAFDSAPNYPQPYYDGEGGSGTFSQALDDENQHHGIQGGPGDDGFGKFLFGQLDFRPGADNYGAVSFNTNLNVVATDGVHTDPVSQLQAIYVDSNGVGHKEDVSVVWTPDGLGGGTLTGFTTDIAKVFTLNVDKFGDYTFCLNAPLAHTFTADPNPYGNQTEFEDNLQIVFTYTVTDGDGDQADAHLPINVDDDVPTLCLDTFQGEGEGAVALDVVHDETPGIQSAHGATDVDGSTAVTFNGSPTTIAALFNGIPNPGDDPDVSGHGAIGYAQGLNGLVNVHAKFGADGAAVNQAEVFSLVLPQGDGEWSGLYTTEGEKVYLYKQTINGHDVIVGRIDADHDLAEDSQPGHFDHFDLHDSDDAAAFAITIDPATGKVYLVQYLSLEHFSSPDAGGDVSEPVELASGTLSVSVTVTDGDGDSVTRTADVGPEIKFLDDGPSVSVSVDRHFSVVLDETPGVQFEDDDTTSSTVRHLFDSVSNKGNDPDVSSGDKDHGALGFAISGGAALDVNAVFGADGPKLDNHGHPDGAAFSLALSSEGVYSGIDTTDGTQIFLFTENGIIVGRVGSSEGAAAFAVTIDDNGHIATAEWLSLHHNSADNGDIDETVQLASGTINAIVTITDGDGDTASASADISSKVQFEDDGPNAHSVTADKILDDEAQSLFPPNFGGPGDVFPSLNTVSDVAGTLFNSGADGTKSVSFTPPAGLKAIYKLASGLAGQETLDYATTTSAGHTVLTATGHTSGNTVFTLDVGNDGSYTFHVFEPLVDPIHSTTEENISVTVGFTVTDGDGDHDPGSLTVKINDDTPTVDVSQAQTEGHHDVTLSTLTLDESIGTMAGDPNAATDDNGAVTAPSLILTPDLTKAIGILSTPTSANGTSVAELFNVNVSFGADGPQANAAYNYSLTLIDDHGNSVSSGSSTGVQTNLVVTELAGTPLQGTSDAQRTIYLFHLADGSIVGKIGIGGGGSVADDIALHIVITGSPSDPQITVEQYLPIEHGNTSSNDESSLLTLHDPDASLGITLTVAATDGDGDTATDSKTITLADKDSSLIKIEDDGPSITSAFASGTVIQDETAGVQTVADPNAQNDVAGSGLPSGVLAQFNAVTNKGVDPDVNPKDNNAIGFATSSSPIIFATADFGTDGPAVTNSTVLALAINGGNGADSGLQTTDGHEIFLFKEGNLIVGRYDGADAGTGVTNTGTDPAAFAIAIGQDGNISLAQYVSLKDPIPGSTDAAHDEPTTGLKNVQATVTFTDGDGDHVSQTLNISGDIMFQDDAPHPVVSATSGTLIIDETAGQDAGTNDVATTPALLALFAALPGSPIQIAQSGAALFTTSGSDYGADGPSAPPNSVFGLNVVNGTDSGLNATDGRSIYLYHEGNLIVGREGDLVTDAANAAGPVALAFSIDSSTGTLTVAEYTAIHHPNPLDPNEAASPQTITNSALQVTFTLTDGDGDTSTASAGIGSLIQFRDDGPSVGPQSNLIVNGSFEEGHTNLSGADWDIYTSLPGWTAGPDLVPFEVQTGGVGGIAAEDGVALIELDGDTFGNPAHQPPSGTPVPGQTDATIQQVVSGTQAGVEYELTFWYTPRPGHSGGDDDGLNVLWNGNVIDTIDSTGQPEGVWQQIHLFVTGTGPGDTLGFQGAGDQDEFGALIDNVSLIQAVVVDEDGLPKGNHDSQPGDIVVPNTDGDNNEATSTGQLNVNWGADNFDAAADTHVSGNPALGFVQDSGGRSLTFTNTVVGITGGTLTSHGDIITLTLSADHTVLTGTAQHGVDPVRTVFEVSLSDDNTGAFRFILEDALDHATDNNENNIALSFNFTATDSDGDTALGNFQVLVNDDVPVAVNDLDSVAGAASIATGNVITGLDIAVGDSNLTDGNADHVGADQPGKITQVVGFGGTDNTADPLTHNFVINGQFGTLSLNEDGDYTYTRTSSSAGTDVFTYTVADDDGDTSTATLTINLEGNRLTQSSTFIGTVEEEELGNTASPPLFPSSFVGNEDTTSALGNDFDTALNSHITTNVTTNTFIVFGGTGPYTFGFASGIEGTQAQFTDSPNAMTSHGAPVYFHIDSGNPNLLIGYADGVGGTADHYDAGTDRVVFTFEITPSTGQGTFSLFDNIDHHTVAAADDVEGTRSLNLNGIVEATDSSPSPQTLALNGSIGIIDDIPVAQPDAARVDEGGTGTTNFLITIDTSASMSEDPGVPGFATRLALEKASLINLLNTANVNEVFIVDFNTFASDSGAWLSKAAAITFISGLTAGGITNYNAALADAETAFTFTHTGADQTLSYFLSDGVPNFPVLGPGIDSTGQATWENFLTTNGVAESFAIGVGNGATLAALDPIEFPNGDPTNPVVLTDQGQLASTLIGSLPGIISGNVLANDHFGADGPLAAGVLSITIDGHLYAYNTGTNSITEDGNPFAAGTGTLDVNTALGGHLDFHFISGVGFNAGDYTYASPPNVNADTPETFHYVIADGDGDKAGADLNITVVAVNDPPVANDDTVITNIAGSGAAIAIPDAALILNDTDVDGPNLTIASVSGATSGLVAHAATTTTFTDDNSDGGAFIYTLHDNGTPDLTDTANVTVDRLQAGNSTINGTGSGEILLDRAGGNDTLVGNGGSDVLVGGDGNDHFLYNATTDGMDHILDFGNGTDSIDFSHSAFGDGVNGLAVGNATTGTLDSSHFVSGTTEGAFSGSGPGFFFNTADHTLYYDSNGNAAGGQIAMAKLENNHALASGEIHVV